MPKGQNKVVLDILVRAKAETAAMTKAKDSMKGLGNQTQKTTKDMHRFRVMTAGTQRYIGALRNVLLLVKFAMATMGIRMFIRQIGSWTKAWAAQEQAVNRLNVALAGVGRYTKQVSEDYQKMAAEMQRASIYGDEAIMEVMQTLMTLGNVADKDMKRATQAVLNFSAATGRDLAAASLLVAKAAVGYTGELSRYGIIIDKSLSKTQKFTATLDFLAKMEGRAEAETYTLDGAVKQLGNTYGDAREKLGKALTETTNLIPALKLMNAWIVIVGKNTATSGEIILDLGNAFIWLLKSMNSTILFFRTFGNVLQISYDAFAGVVKGIILLGQVLLSGLTYPLKAISWIFEKFFTNTAKQMRDFANLVAKIKVPIPGKGKLITGLNAIADAFDTAKGSTDIWTAANMSLNASIKDTLNEIIKASPSIRGHLQDMLNAGDSYNKVAGEIDELIKRYPKLKKQFQELKNQMLENKKIDDDTTNSFLANFAKGLHGYKEFAKNVESTAKSLARTLESTMSSVLVDAWNADLKTAYDYYVAFRQSVYKVLADYISKEVMATMAGERAKLIAKRWAAIQSVAIAAWSAIKSAASSMYQFVAGQLAANAKLGWAGIALAAAAIVAGGAMLAGYSKFAKGGIVTDRTNAIIGEAGPEAVVPLKRGPGGKLGIASYGGANGGGGGTVVENHYYINAVDSRSFVDLVNSNPSAITNVVSRNIRRNQGLRTTIGAYT